METIWELTLVVYFAFPSKFLSFRSVFLSPLVCHKTNRFQIVAAKVLSWILFLTYFRKRVMLHSICHWRIPLEAFQWDDEFYCSETAQQPGQLLEWREPLDHLKCVQSLDKTLVKRKYTLNKYDFKVLFRTRSTI